MSPRSVTWSDLAQELGVRLHRARVEHGLSQEALAQAAGISRNYYGRMEHGLSATSDEPANPSLKVLVRLCVELDVPLDELVPHFASMRWE